MNRCRVDALPVRLLVSTAAVHQQGSDERVSRYHIAVAKQTSCCALLQAVRALLSGLAAPRVLNPSRLCQTMKGSKERMIASPACGMFQARCLVDEPVQDRMCDA